MFIGVSIFLIIMLIAFSKWWTIAIIVGFASYMYLKTLPGGIYSLQSFKKRYDATTVTPQ